MWSDLFYPENPKRREDLIRRSQEIKELMKNNFRATNQLSDCMNKYLGCSFQHISVNENVSLRENCDVIIGTIRKIQAEVEKINEKLKNKLEPTLYEKLRKLSSLSTIDYKKIALVFETICGIGSVGSTVLFGCLLKKGAIFSRVTGTFARIGATVLAGVVLTVVFLGIDMIIQAIIGKIEGDKLKAALDEYDRALAEFRPASEQFQDDITYVRVKIEIMHE